MRQGAREDLAATALLVDAKGREIALGREAGASGRLRSTLNGAPSSVEALRERGGALVVVHGQHDSLRLRHRSEVRALLDASGGVDDSELEQIRARLRQGRAERETLGGSEVDRSRELDFLTFQLDELARARLSSPRELHELLEELEHLSQLRDGQAALSRVIDGLDDGPASSLGQLARAVVEIPPGEAYDAAREVLRGALAQAREAVSDLARLSDPEAVDLRRVGQLEDRVALLSEIARKYGSLERALEESVVLAERRRHLEAVATRRAQLDAELAGLLEAEAQAARALRGAREAAARRLERRVSAQLPRVALVGAALRFDVQGTDGSQVELLFRAGPGQAEGPLAGVASGGELSRVLLALALETVGDDAVAVFDEIDAGLGGQVAQQIGECLAELGASRQVLAVTHLASVAARAEHHFVVEKQLSAEGALTTVREVRGAERVREVARMLAGDSAGEESRALATRLLDTHS